MIVRDRLRDRSTPAPRAAPTPPRRPSFARSTAAASCGSASRAASTTARSASTARRPSSARCSSPGELQIPLVGELDTSGAELRDGVAALHAWGRLARELVHVSGRVPTLARGHRRLRVGPRARARAVRPRRDDRRRVRLRHRARIGRRVHRRARVARASSAARACTRRAPASRRSSSPTKIAARDALAALLCVSPRPPPRRSAALACSTIRAIGRARSRRGDGPDAADRVVRRARRDRRRARRRLVPRSARRGTRRTSSPGSARSTAARSASSRTSRCSAPARSTSRRRARRRASSRGATRSTCRSSRSSTRPGFEPGRDLEWRGMIRHGAELVHAYAAATVPRLLRRAAQGVRRRVHRHGLAWHRQRPLRRVAERRDRGDGRGAGAVAILDARAATDPAARRRVPRTTFENPYRAAERGLVDAVIEPEPTRRVLVRRARGARRRSATASRRAAHSNTPL